MVHVPVIPIMVEVPRVLKVCDNDIEGFGDGHALCVDPVVHDVQGVDVLEGAQHLLQQ